MPVPPMHWQSWNTFNARDNRPNETNMKEIADALISSGLADAGFRTVDVVCSGWLERNATGFLTENRTRWPSGMKGLADYLHERGLWLGVYTSPGEI